MFGSKKNEPTAKKSNGLSQAAPSHALNSLVKGTEVRGTITTESDIRVDGHLSGDLACATKLIIGPSGSIEGDVQCENALIEGNFNGNLIVRSTLHIKENAKIEGDIKADKLIVDQGAVFNVTCNMGSGVAPLISNKKKKKVVEGVPS